ncbi:tRNA nucleotidyltransferase [Moraxella marmotae]|uniref:tRNA nucleotidyltransferase n=1 Tax=Moraxella marmotae TaxID=3344520 RepID=UPI0035F27B16
MQVYLVGGAVRDALLGLPVADKDFMVVGATADELLAQGFCQVGADFPVFLHPDTHAEYALARLERKTGTGHTAFSVQASADVRLEDDLLRRDLTINALAMPVHGLFDDTPVGDTVMDFYGGLDDLKHRILRHVSPAFSEDPLRVLRVARFFARLSPLGFVIHDSTAALMTQIAKDGELSTLSRERIWAEFARALMYPAGHCFITCLHQLQILGHILPMLDDALAKPSIYQAAISRLQTACQNNAPLAARLAMLFVDLPSDAISDCLKQLNAPKAIAQFVHVFANHHQTLLKLPAISSDELLTLIEHTKAHKDSTLLMQLYDACQLYQNAPMPYPASWLDDAIHRYQSVSMANIDRTLTGKAIGDELTRQRRIALHGLLGNFQMATALTIF